MDYKYRDFLPNYLDGGNIRNHAGNIEKQDKIIADKNLLLRNWNKLTPVILIERVCEYQSHILGANTRAVNPTPGGAWKMHLMYILHVSVDEFIERIEVNGEILNRFSEQDAVMEYTHHILNKIKDSGDFWNNPQVQVDVYTYDDNKYSKGYPENDFVCNNVYDHDEDLDRIGAIMGLERRTYNSYDVVDGDKSVPSYWGKSNVNNVISVCTEDDYYYLQRLLYLISHYQTMDLCKLYIYLIYNVDLHISHDYDMYDVQQGNFIYLVDRNTVFPSNIDAPPLNQELSADVYLGRFIPLSREAYVVWQLLLYYLDVLEEYADGVKLIQVLDLNDEPITSFSFDTGSTLHGLVTSDEDFGTFRVYPCDTVVNSLIPVDSDTKPVNEDYSIPSSTPMSFIEPSNWVNEGSRGVVVDSQQIGVFNGCKSFSTSVDMQRDNTYYTMIDVDGGGVNSGFVLRASDNTEYLVPSVINGDTVTGFYTASTSVMVLHDNIVLRELSFVEDYKLGVYCTNNDSAFYVSGIESYLSRDVPVPAATLYGLGTDNPWTTDNTLNAIFDKNHPGWLITTYAKQSTGTTVNIPLQGDFEIEVKLNIMSTSGVQGTAIFGLYGSQGNSVFTVTQDNKLNGQTINTVYPNCDYFGPVETFTLKREGTSYTYKHGEETRTLTINNTGTLYFKMTKTGNADLGMSTMGVTEL